MTTGIPRSHHDVVRAARDLGYSYDHTTGGHVFYTKDDPDSKLGQQKRLIIPTDIKSEKTLRNILDGMGYFEANGLNKNGQPKVKKSAAQDTEAEVQKLETRFIKDVRAWKQQMRQHLRHDQLFAHPGPQPQQPAEVAAAPACPKGPKR